MLVKELIKLLKQADQNKNILLASDEEWNTIFKKVEVVKDSDTGDYVIFGYSGSELEEIYE